MYIVVQILGGSRAEQGRAGHRAKQQAGQGGQVGRQVGRQATGEIDGIG